MAKQTPYKLSESIQFNDKTYTEVTITYKRKFLRGELIKAGASESLNSKEGVVYLDPGQIERVASKMIGELPEIFDEMADEDADFIMAEASDFLLRGLGKKKES